MKNLTIDSLLKALTIFCYILIYSVAGFAVFRVVRAPSQIIPSTPETYTQITETQMSTPTVTPEIGVNALPVSSAPSPTIAPTVDSRCIITVNGSKYNVTDFRIIHGGGDIFACNTDMTSAFFGQHSERILREMSNYKL